MTLRIATLKVAVFNLIVMELQIQGFAEIRPMVMEIYLIDVSAKAQSAQVAFTQQPLQPPHPLKHRLPQYLQVLNGVLSVVKMFCDQ